MNECARKKKAKVPALPKDVIRTAFFGRGIKTCVLKNVTRCLVTFKE